MWDLSWINAIVSHKGNKQERLAEELNVSFQSISRWENGISTPDISLIPVIARYFGDDVQFKGLQERIGGNNIVI